MRVPIVPILSTLQLHSGVVCCSPLPCAIMFDSSSVPRLFSVYDYVRFFIFLQTYDGKRCVPGTCAISHCYFAVIHTTGRDCYPARRVLVRLFYDCLACTDCTDFFRLVRARSNSSVVCSGVNFLSCSIAKAVAIASAISSLVAVYRFI